jgi:hypothetical protein
MVHRPTDKEVRGAIMRNAFGPRNVAFYGIFMSASAATYMASAKNK